MTDNYCAAVNEHFYNFTHRTGLDVCVIKKKGLAKTFAGFATNFGSVDTFCCQPDGTRLPIPPGTAHFLEHKLFENEDGDAFAKYAVTGADANAFTDFDRTVYLFSCTDNFEKSFEILLDMVQHPYFTEQTVSKEQGIIGQEIKMYEDDPEWRVIMNLLGALYSVNPVRIDIAGTVESIAQITPDLLYACCDAYYNPCNMTLVVCGDVEPETVEKLCDSLLAERKCIAPVRVDYDEPERVAAAEVSLELPVSRPMFNIGYKDNASATGLESVKNALATEMLLELICGRSSDAYSGLYSAGLINDGFKAEFVLGRGFALSLFSGESDDPRAVAQAVSEAIVRIKTDGIDSDDFRRVKRLLYGRLLRRFDSVESAALMYVDLKFRGVTPDEYVAAFDSVTPEMCQKRLNEHFIDSNRAISTILPVKEEVQ